ncbi:unnamed protein product [Cylicocyclus nassatus]|uniref:Uncharacterized protein n=1 Tax=Cylicocyclus nassatus TaxID=53992 RepID=A0AA36DIH2_CYLNA|nr:unnamed protein product [Cylicocyclus nassatus]
MLSYTVTVTVFASIASATVISRAKRQFSNYYACGGSGYSSIGCGAYSGCGTNCAGSTIILPSTNYAPSSICQNLCSSINCNQYNGQYVNGLYVANGYGSAYGSTQYNPCASSCCYGDNNFNQPLWGNALVVPGSDWLNSPYGNGGNIYTPYVNPITQVGPGPVVISANIQRSPTAFTEIVSNGVLLAVAVNQLEALVLRMDNVQQDILVWLEMFVVVVPSAQVRVGTCPSGSDLECPVGYACSTTLSCCPSEHIRGSILNTCNNGGCHDGYECGKGNLCYPSYK